MPAFLRIISKIIISFEEQTKKFNFILSKSDRNIWLNALIANIYVIWIITLILLIMPTILCDINKFNIEIIFNFIWSNFIVNIGWILIYIFLGIKIDSNADIFIGFLSIPFLTFYGISSMSKNIWKILPFLYTFKYGVVIKIFSIYSIIAIIFTAILYIGLSYWFNHFEKN